MEDIIRDFLECSIKKDFSDFDFDDAFYQFGCYLNDKLIEHGFCDEEAFIDKYIERMKDFGYEDNATYFTLSTNYIYISQDEVLEAIAKLHYKKAIEAFSGLKSYKILVELREKLYNWDSLSECELIQLFDECIHSQHETGSIIDCDIEKMKKELDKKYENVKIEKMFEPVNA